MRLGNFFEVEPLLEKTSQLPTGQAKMFENYASKYFLWCCRCLIHTPGSSGCKNRMCIYYSQNHEIGTLKADNFQDILMSLLRRESFINQVTKEGYISYYWKNAGMP